MKLTTKTKIKVTMLGAKTAEIKFSDPQQARDYFDQLRAIGVLAGEAIKNIELV